MSEPFPSRPSSLISQKKKDKLVFVYDPKENIAEQRRHSSLSESQLKLIRF